MRLAPVTSTANRKAITTGASVEFDTDMAEGFLYVFTCTTDMYINQDATSATATAGDGSVLISAGDSCVIEGRQGAKLAAIAATADGEATLTRAKVLG